MSIRGKCLCGAVSYEVTGPYDYACHWHCSPCRRAHDAGCWKGVINAVTLGTMQGEAEIHPGQHIFTGSKAPWIKITDGMPEYEAYSSDFDG
ncbi:MAG: hypothetical protein AAF353_02755 [Pseudomonadota bacterium]